MPKKTFRGSDLPKGWLRFVSLPGEIERVGEDGNVVASVDASPEEQLRMQGWSDQEIEHATGVEPRKPGTKRLSVGGRG